MKILLIEDDTQLCMTIKEQLTKEGYIVDTCNAGDEAFLYAVDPDNDYDLAIIDRMLLLLMVYPSSKPCGRKTFRFLSSSLLDCLN